nr:CDP-glucose 4,6-dehydratase [Silvibacterium bohemicum]
MENVVNTWRGRRVFLTGHTGFKGGWLSLWLTKLGAQVRGYALEPLAQPSMFYASEVGKLVDDIRGNVLDKAHLEESMAEFAPEVVFHLAAQPLVRESYSDPLTTYATNVMGTATMLEAVRKTPSIRAVVSITTDKCYENREWVWPYRETDALGGYDPYSSSKACAEMVCAAYRSSFFPVDALDQHHVALATARAGNVIGGGDWSRDRLIPDLIEGFRTNQPVLIRRPASIRPWQHVLEPLHGYILLAERLLEAKPEFATSFNLGPSDDDAWPVDRVATKVAELWGPGSAWTQPDDPGAHEARYLRLDSSKARAELHWQPRLRIETALEWTVAWYRAWNDGQPMQEFTLKQISAYENRAQ